MPKERRNLGRALRLLGLLLIAPLSAYLVWSTYDTFVARQGIIEEAKISGKSVYEIAIERGRSDVVDMQMMVPDNPYGRFNKK